VLVAPRRARNRTIEITSNIPSGINELEDSTKGKVGHRTIDMGRDLADALKAMLAKRKSVQMESGDRTPSLWLFPAKEGGPMDYNRFHDDWTRAQKLAGVRFRSPHSLRHTYASVSLHRGEDLAYVSRQLGHANPSITLSIYTHFMPRKRRRAANVLDRAGREPSARNPHVETGTQE
jgi:integrase